MLLIILKLFNYNIGTKSQLIEQVKLAEKKQKDDLASEQLNHSNNQFIFFRNY